MGDWVKISVGIFTVVYTGVNIVKAIWSLSDVRRKNLDSIIADGVDFTWVTYVKKIKRSGTWNDVRKNRAMEKCKNYINSRLSSRCCVSETRLERLIHDRINYKKKSKYIKKRENIQLTEV